MKSSTCLHHSTSSQIGSMDFKLTSNLELETQIIFSLMLMHILITVCQTMYIIEKQGYTIN